MKENEHLIEDGDPHTDEAWCHCRKWKIKHFSRNFRIAQAYRHLADQLDPPVNTPV